jgi:molybdenum-dependent DNA-binding transcriptional regulator ModE
MSVNVKRRRTLEQAVVEAVEREHKRFASDLHDGICQELAGKGKSGSSLRKWLGRLRYKHLSLLVALDEHRNLHRAAKVVHLAQPSASKLVQDLELLFGSPPFDRLPTGMQPTELGVVVLAFARSALGDLRRLAAEVDHRQAGRDGDRSNNGPSAGRRGTRDDRDKAAPTHAGY